MLSEDSVAEVKRLFPREKVGGLTIGALCDVHEQMRVALEKLAEGTRSWAENARNTGNPVPTHIVEMWLKIARLEEEPNAPDTSR